MQIVDDQIIKELTDQLKSIRENVPTYHQLPGEESSTHTITAGIDDNKGQWIDVEILVRSKATKDDYGVRGSEHLTYEVNSYEYDVFLTDQQNGIERKLTESDYMNKLIEQSIADAGL